MKEAIPQAAANALKNFFTGFASVLDLRGAGRFVFSGALFIFGRHRPRYLM
jgi:hypothetical protein